ncbi:hypothetical protein GALL_150050 [mine drainage metagenome]|uniref:Cell division protein ZipA n=1 Tax=mine drainage metagenome TaxID=410659 RepID=A0A1J5SF17_9ZZZZ
MTSQLGTLHLLCGKIASGKSTLAKELVKTPNTVILSEDEWLANLYPSEIKSITDYIRCSGHLRGAMEKHVAELLRIGVSVVLDFPANTVANRKWMKGILKNVHAEHVLHFLDVSDDHCLMRLRARNASGTHAFVVEDAEFDRITSYFVAPQLEEEFNILRY